MYPHYTMASSEAQCVCVVLCLPTGNACVLKPSELSVATSNLMSELVPQYLDKVSSLTLYTSQGQSTPTA